MEKITKTNLILCFIIFDLVAVLITIATWRAKDSQQIINEVSLWSGLASIVLAIVAIGFAFLQSYQSTKQSIEVSAALEKINEKVKGISDIQNQVSEIKNNLTLNATMDSKPSSNFTIHGENQK
ncbi:MULTISPECIES: hypothetical protein [unclassified Lysinibacillus]|uniref:hypothetical protein n=1 Tax=unclassified Lysinibacillus TaxID=2636778 RepID=UPI0023314184|nr:hypothetical protein [Lysinibacillus sp. OF-1]WCH45813.1 hypothetical protein NV349_11910 [Lysinibacillus sp. OF-1]